MSDFINFLTVEITYHIINLKKYFFDFEVLMLLNIYFLKKYLWINNILKHVFKFLKIDFFNYKKIIDKTLAINLFYYL